MDIVEDSVIEGKALKAGEYRIEMQNDTAMITQGKQTIAVPAHRESVTDKFDNTELVYESGQLQEIHVDPGSRLYSVAATQPLAESINPNGTSRFASSMAIEALGARTHAYCVTGSHKEREANESNRRGLL